MLIDKIRNIYPKAETVEDEANCEMSVKFRKNGFIVDHIFTAIQCKNSIEIYDNQGVMVETI